MTIMLDRLNIYKKIDSLGRVVIPKSVRDKMGIKDGDELEIVMIDGWIGLKKKVEVNDDRVQIAIEVLEEHGLPIPGSLLKSDRVVMKKTPPKEKKSSNSRG